MSHHRFSWRLWNGSPEHPEEYRLFRGSTEYVAAVYAHGEWTLRGVGPLAGLISDWNSFGCLADAKAAGLARAREQTR